MFSDMLLIFLFYFPQGVEYFIRHALIDDTPLALAKFIHNTNKLDRFQVRQLLTKRWVRCHVLLGVYFLKHTAGREWFHLPLWNIFDKGSGYFLYTKHNVHRITFNSRSLRIMMVESFSYNITCWGAGVFFRNE